MDNKFALLTLEYPPQTGGVARMYEQLVKVLPGKIDVYVQRPEQLERNEYVTYVSFLRDNPWPRWWPTIRLVREIWKTGKYQSIIVGHVLPLGTAVRILQFFTKLRYEVIVHGMDVNIPAKNKWKKHLLRWVLRGAHGVIAANKKVADKVVSLGVSPQNVHIVYPIPGVEQRPAVDTIRQLAQSYGLHNGPVLLTVARLVERKGVQDVIESLASIWKKYPTLNYVIIGKGPYENELREKISNLAKPHQVHLLTNQTDSDIASWYGLSDIFIMTPTTLPNGDIEGLGIVYLEAALYRKPSIGTRHGGVPEAIIDGETGLLVSESNSSEIAEAVISLLNDKELMRSFGVAAENRVKYAFSKHNQEKQLIEALYD